jgi:ATP-binding cassette, subfamily B, bacterial
LATLLSTKKPYIDPRDVAGVDRVILTRILAYLRPYGRQSAGIGLLIVGGACLALLPPLFLKEAIDQVVAGAGQARPGGVGRLLLLCAGMVAAPLVVSLLGLAQKYLQTMVAERVMLDLRLKLYEHLHRLELGFFVSARPGEAVSNVLNDVQGVGAVVSSTLVGLVDNAAVFVTTAALLFWLDWRLALLAFALLPLFVAPTRRAGRERKRIKRESQAALAELTGLLIETLSVSGAQLVKMFGSERTELARLRRQGEEIVQLSLRQTLAGRRFQLLVGLFESLAPALAVAVGGALILSGRGPAVGTLVACVAVLKRLYSPASGLAGVHADLVTSYAYFERVFRVLDRKPRIADAPHAVSLAAVRGEIRFEQVSLAFPDGGGEGLSGVDFRVEPGQCVAIVGHSGAGKTTLGRLVCRLYDPTAGRVLLDGRDLRALTQRSLRSHLAVVTQETYLFHASILENLRYARPTASQDEIEAAARAAQIHALIASLPQGYDTVVGDRGYRLSGGERQRIAIARALLRNPRLLILDEATSALDPENETLVQAALEPLMRGRTSLVITHRLATVRAADQIIVLDKGRVAERGTHDELVAAGGVYAQLLAEPSAWRSPEAAPERSSPVGLVRRIAVA